MKKMYVAMLASIISIGAIAQKGKNYLGAGADMSLPMGDFADYYKRGMGVYGKAILGVGQAGAVSFSIGYSGFKEIANFDETTSTAVIVPFLIGYRRNFNGFFVEPQLGYALYPYKHNSAEDGFYTTTGSAFNWALNAGYMFKNKLEVSARYQTGTSTGITVSVVGLRLGYNFSLDGSK